MPAVRAEDRLKRAAELRALAKKCHSAVAQRAFEIAADRLERLAAKAVRRIGIPVQARR